MYTLQQLVALFIPLGSLLLVGRSTLFGSAGLWDDLACKVSLFALDALSLLIYPSQGLELPLIIAFILKIFVPLELKRLESAPQHSTAVGVALDELHHPAEKVEAATEDSTSHIPSAGKCSEQVPQGSWTKSLYSQFRTELSKVLRLQIDCGLYGSDWRLVYAGSSLVGFGPCALMFLRGAVSIAHLVALIFAKFHKDMLFFTTWTNLTALAGFFLSTVVSIVAVCSLSSQWHKDKSPSGPESPASGAVRCGLLSRFHRANAVYRQLLKQKTELGCDNIPSSFKVPDMRRCFAFRRPFSGSPRRPALEALLSMYDIAWGLAFPMNVVMFLVYWTMLFPMTKSSIEWVSIYLHLCCPVATWFLGVVSRAPYRLTVFPLSIVLGLTYVVMIFIMQCFGFGFVYWFLNFQERPFVAAGVVCCVVFVLNPLTSCLSFLVLHRNNCGVIPTDE